jgi:hypothetical protein
LNLDRDEELGCEALLYAGPSAYKALTGDWGPPDRVPRADNPSGDEWDEDADALRSRYPAVMAKFWDG